MRSEETVHNMRISANQLTLLRILLLPFPLFLVYGGAWSRVAAIVAYTILGVTDYLDGLLARRDGPTKLGAMLDPIADKIFIAVTLVPLVELQIVPLWLAWLVFFREYLVTELRRFMTGINRPLAVTELAKLKTTLQMIGMGLILLTDTFPDKIATGFCLAGAFIATIFLAIAIHWKEGVISSRLKSALLFLSVGLVLLLGLNTRHVILAYMIVIVGITLISGAQYAAIGIAACFKNGLGALIMLLFSIGVPLLPLALMNHMQGLTVWLLIFLLSSEFAGQALEMWLHPDGHSLLVRIKNIATLLLILAAWFGVWRLGLPMDSIVWVGAVASGGFTIWNLACCIRTGQCR